MKIAVYLSDTAELIGIVECSYDFGRMLADRRYYSMAKWQMPRIDLAMAEMPTNQSVERIDFEVVQHHRSNHALAIALFVKKREHLAIWEAGRTVWPRKRDKKYKPSKAERAYRRGMRGPLVGTRGHITMVDDPHDNMTPRS